MTKNLNATDNPPPPKKGQAGRQKIDYGEKVNFFL